MTRMWSMFGLWVAFSAFNATGCGGVTGAPDESDSADIDEPGSASELAKFKGSTTSAELAIQGGSVTPVVPAVIGPMYQRDAFRNLLAGEMFTATAMCDTGDLLIAHYVAGQNITVNSRSLVDPVVLFTGAATQGWRAVVTGNSAGPPRFVNVTAICLDFMP